jgi:diguanylate cyclase (GGDEF)-like protein
LDNIRGRSNAVCVAEKILATLQQHVHLGPNSQCKSGASIGIALWPDDGIEIDALIGAADEAMYQAKHEGDNSIRYFRHQMPVPSRRKSDLKLAT